MTQATDDTDQADSTLMGYPVGPSLLLVGLLALAVPVTAGAQCRGLNGSRVAVIGGVFVAGEAAAIALRHSDWWTPPRRSFHVVWGGSPSKGQDGLLHATISYQASQLAALGWDWACVPRVPAGWLGAALGLALGIPKEIGDGLHQNGFSGPDMLWSTAGSVLPALHRQLPSSRVLQPKAFYWPSAEYRNRTGVYPQLENDYAGQRFFLSLNPARAGKTGRWPPWLGLAVGHGVPHWATIPPEHDWYVSLDLDWRGVPIRAPWWPKVAAVLDQGHVPMPGLRIRSGTVAFGMF